MILIYEKGFTVSKIDKIEYGQDIFVLSVTYSDINCIPELFSVEDVLPLLNDHFKSSIKDLEEILTLMKKYDDFEELLQDWRDQFSYKFSEKLADISKNDKVFSHFLRVLYIPFPDLYQSELYLFENGKREAVDYSDEDTILMHLMLLRGQHKTKTPSNTIRKLK